MVRSSLRTLRRLAVPALAAFLAAAAPAAGQIFLQDTEIIRAVEELLRRDPHVRAGQITVASMGGVVTLHGVVPSGLVRERATNLVDGIHGVLSVNNELLVRPDAAATGQAEAGR